MLALVAGCHYVGGVKGSGTITTAQREVTAFSQIGLASVIDAEITSGPQAKVELTGDDNLLPLITTKVVGDKLEIDTAGGQDLRPSQRLVARIVVAKLSEVDVTGTGAVQINNVTADTLKLELSGTGSVVATGHAAQLGAELSGTGKLRLAQFPVEQATIDLSGTGSAELAVSRQLDVNLSGTGSVTYHGNPKVTQAISGTGSVRQQ
jgi:hypothetical protein